MLFDTENRTLAAARFHWVTFLSALSVLVLVLCQSSDSATPFTAIASENSGDQASCAALSQTEVASCRGVGARPDILPGFAAALLFTLTILLSLHRSVDRVRRTAGSTVEVGGRYAPATLRLLRRSGSIFLQVLRL